MERSLEKFIEHQNILRYTDQLKIETDSVKRKLLLKLLVEEEAKQKNHTQSKEK